MLKVNIDRGQDYLDYLKPFILDILAKENIEIINDEKIHELLLSNFGLDIPNRSIQVILKRLSKKHPIKKESGIYKVTGNLKPKTDISTQKTEVERHIKAVISGLIEFSKSTVTPIGLEEKAVKALLDFLSRFNIPCLKAYLRGTAIPNIEQSYKGDIVLVSKYVIHLQKTDLARFKRFMILVQGHMCANALTCPDLAQVPDTYKKVTFYFDTPLLVQLFGLDIQYNQEAVKNLIYLLRKLDGKVAVFSHSRDELKQVIQNSAEYLDNPKGRGNIVREARRSGKTKSDLLLLVQQVDDKLAEFDISEEQTPQYEPKFQIDEQVLDTMLEDGVSHRNLVAKKHDINSVRSIYVLRKGTAPATVERSRAVLVTSNTKFAKVAWQYGKKHEELSQVSSVITDFSLANMAWLKAPMGAVDLPEIEVLAFSYSALRPSKELLNKYLDETERLEKQGKITPRSHQLLRSHPQVDKELMDLTMGDEEALRKETITETLSRITNEIKKEESGKLTEEQRRHKETLSRITNEIKKEESGKLTTEQRRHKETQKKLNEERQKAQNTKNRLYWRCKEKANFYSWFLTGLLIILQIGLVFLSIWFKLSLLLAIIISLLIVAFNVFGLTYWKVQKKFQKWLEAFLLKKEEKATGLDLSNKGIS